MSDGHPKKQEYRTLLSQSGFLFTVFYRGHWCPFCISYLKRLQSLSEQISSAGGSTVIITAESEENLAKTRQASRYTGRAISDPENAIAGELKQRFGLDITITPKSGYPNGMAQPAILVLKPDGTVVYNWAIVPKVSNLGGATDRPVLDDVVTQVLAEIRGTAVPSCKPPTTSKTSVGGLLWEKIFGKQAPQDCK
ncbi:MAG: hypothetical protein LQ350_000321 [Teloschistes chrysophthalmus]|nr:MAG: hypothetical protein LQ350_000321 [Niorma chrysophthalma]